MWLLIYVNFKDSNRRPLRPAAGAASTAAHCDVAEDTNIQFLLYVVNNFETLKKMYTILINHHKFNNFTWQCTVPLGKCTIYGINSKLNKNLLQRFDASLHI